MKEHPMIIFSYRSIEKDGIDFMKRYEPSLILGVVYLEAQ
jgi:hypothetical protein